MLTKATNTVTPVLKATKSVNLFATRQFQNTLKTGLTFKRQLSNASSIKKQEQEPEVQVTSESLINLEAKYGAHNYHPLPVVFSKAEGVNVYDPEGHCHPKIVEALITQASKLTLSSRAFYNDRFGEFAKYVTEYFKYDMVLPMNTGAEAVETAIKLARKWGYEKKKIPEGEAIVLSCADNFHGRTMGIISMSTDPTATTNFGPYLPNVGPQIPGTDRIVRYNNIEDLEFAFQKHGKNIAGFLIEPVQGEAGIVVPDDAYLQRAHQLCKEYNILFIADEVQSGLARTGKMLAIEYSGVRPDVVILGKALSGGVYPVSCVLADKEVMLCIQPGEHGSTYGGNPLASAVAIAALQVIKDENLVERSFTLGKKFRDGLLALNNPAIKEVRGRGLLNAIVVDDAHTNGRTAWDLCLLMKANGLLAKPTHNTIIRLAPPLTISEEQVAQGIQIIKKSLEALKTAPKSGE